MICYSKVAKELREVGKPAWGWYRGWKGEGHREKGGKASILQEET